jgi:hypothetical protein
MPQQGHSLVPQNRLQGRILLGRAEVTIVIKQSVSVRVRTRLIQRPALAMLRLEDEIPEDSTAAALNFDYTLLSRCSQTALIRD